MAARTRSRAGGNRGGDHRLRDPRHPHAGARHDDRQRRAALHAGQRLGEPGPDQLGADLLHRRRRDHDAADRLSRRPVRAASACSSSPIAGFTVASMLCGMAQSLVADRAVPRAAGRCSARRWCRCRRPCCSTSIREERQGSAMALFGVARDGRAGARPGARRLADRELQLALGLLHQPADRHPRLRSA